ncbi:uncharacterized protein BDW43DRAFT_317229 [Aspergillus alliaceus]|uniref:uncharacterized protein n=1 Tax=Petromyces alliaceus TaxID=209559 RepID=UPI0012A4EB9A|nr:uncharacterized protein BDW43DRAFT_317229 [Aspergillus alliaceus]KAB8227014.1 hypothetical protein BDW43DRAFT_317229 [Aspergillus alliaceus]
MKDPKFKPPPDLIQLVIDGSPDGKGRSLDYQVNAQIGTGHAALFTTAVTVFHILCNLCEAQRFNKFILVSIIRKVAKPLMIATGDILPKGTICGIDIHSIHFQKF